jgi:hypothetical protein
MTMPEGDVASPYEPRPRLLQTFGGLWIAGLGLWLCWVAWRQGSLRGEFSVRAAMLGPAFLVMGLGLARFGGYREERLARGENLEGRSGMQLLTRRWWVLLISALVAAALYTVVLWQGWLG